MKKVLVAGCGLVGKTIALDLSQDFDVTVMDPSESSLASIDNPNIKKIRKSVTDADSLFEIAKDMDVVCGLVPQPFLKQLHTQIIDMGKNYVSPSGYRLSEGLDTLAKKRGCTGVCDIGIAPGMSNYLLAKGAEMLEELDFGCIYVTGIPDKLDPPFNYRIVLCLEDTMREYCRPARYIKDGQLTTAPALSGIEDVYIPGIGKLEAFFTDGLCSAADNIKGNYIAEKTMRWPGYVDTINVLKAAGCFGTEPIRVDGMEIVPFNVTAELLRPIWKLRPENGDRDLTIMRIVAKGPREGKYVTYTWDMIDKFDEKNNLHSMARTTAFPCATAARAIANGIISEKGFFTPELLIENKNFDSFLMSELKIRGMNFKLSTLIEEL